MKQICIYFSFGWVNNEQICYERERKKCNDFFFFLIGPLGKEKTESAKNGSVQSASHVGFMGQLIGPILFFFGLWAHFYIDSRNESGLGVV